MPTKQVSNERCVHENYFVHHHSFRTKTPKCIKKSYENVLVNQYSTICFVYLAPLKQQKQTKSFPNVSQHNVKIKKIQGYLKNLRYLQIKPKDKENIKCVLNICISLENECTYKYTVHSSFENKWFLNVCRHLAENISTLNFRAGHVFFSSFLSLGVYVFPFPNESSSTPTTSRECAEHSQWFSSF